MKRTVLLCGDAGTGKTTQINTLPGKVLVYAFDSNVQRAIRRDDIEVVSFLPPFDSYDLAPFTLKGERDKDSKAFGRQGQKEPRVYPEWAADVNRRHDDGSLSELDWLVFDSTTSLTEAVLDRTLYDNDRLGRSEEPGDYKIAGMRLANVIRLLSVYPMSMMFISHLKTQETKNSKGEVLKSDIILSTYGRAHATLRNNCDEIWQTLNQSRDTEKRVIQTRSDYKSFQSLRSSVLGLEKYEDVTLDWLKPLEGQGIAGLGVAGGKQKQ